VRYKFVTYIERVPPSHTVAPMRRPILLHLDPTRREAISASLLALHRQFDDEAAHGDRDAGILRRAVYELYHHVCAVGAGAPVPLSSRDLRLIAAALPEGKRTLGRLVRRDPQRADAYAERYRDAHSTLRDLSGLMFHWLEDGRARRN
jgi:hypothetical protein